MKVIEIKLNRSLRGQQAGAIVRIPTNRDGLPKDRYWRDRLKDAEIDGCCEIVNSPPKQKKVKRDA